MLTAIIVAAGSSKRVGFDKLFSKLGDRSVLEHALAAFEEAESVSEIIVVCRDPKLVQDAINRAGGRKVRAVVRGGERRQDSVQAGLKELAENSEFVAVHDAARPLITPREIERVFSAARKHGAAVLAAPITETLKFADANQVVSGSIDRQNVFAMQTPQIFRRASLLEAITATVRRLAAGGGRRRCVVPKCRGVSIRADTAWIGPGRNRNQIGGHRGGHMHRAAIEADDECSRA